MGAIEIKHHPPVLHGEISTLEPELGYGYLRADDGREVHFQRDALTSDVWDHLAKGSRLRFREMQGERVPMRQLSPWSNDTIRASANLAATSSRARIDRFFARARRGSEFHDQRHGGIHFGAIKDSR